MPHGTPLTASQKRTPRVTIPNVDFRQFQRDPIGAGISTLIQTLTIAQNEFARRDDNYRSDAFRQAEDIFQATELRGKEISQQELLGQLEPIFDRRIQLHSPFVLQRVNGTLGRTAGANFAQDLRNRITNQEFGTQADLNTAFNVEADRIAALTEFGQDGYYAAGWLETTRAAAPRSLP